MDFENSDGRFNSSSTSSPLTRSTTTLQLRNIDQEHAQPGATVAVAGRFRRYPQTMQPDFGGPTNPPVFLTTNWKFEILSTLPGLGDLDEERFPMALIECGECGRQVSDKALACPGCGAPTTVAGHLASGTPRLSSPRATISGSSETARRSRFLPLLLALLAGAGYIAYRANSGLAGSARVQGMPEAFRQPRKLVFERVGLKEGQAMMYSFTIASPARVEVKISAEPKNVDVMLMTAADLESYKRARGKLFGGRYSYREALSRQGIQAMTESETLPQGEWAIVVQRPEEDAFFKKDTAATIEVTAY